MSNIPGPWRIQGTQKDTEIGGFYVVGPDGESCTAYVANLWDAGLIASAPDLLKLLEELAQMAHDDGQLFSDESLSKPFYIVHEQKIRAAIKKARGE